MKTTKTLVSLLLVAVTVLTLPLAALAQTISGSYNGYGYVCVSGGSHTQVTDNMTYGTSAKLEIVSTPHVYYYDGSGYVPYTTYHSMIVMKTAATSVSQSYTTTGFRNKYSDVPSNGYFDSCDFSYRIALHTVDGWSEQY